MPRPVFQTRTRLVDLAGGLPVLVASADVRRVAIGFASNDSANADIQIGWSDRLNTEGFFLVPTSGVEWITYQNHGDLIFAEYWGLHTKAPSPFVNVIELVWVDG